MVELIMIFRLVSDQEIFPVESPPALVNIAEETSQLVILLMPS